MRVNTRWLKQYVDFDYDPWELAEVLTNVGLESSLVYDLSSIGENVVVGKILKVEKHPQADRLYVCVVTDGRGEYQVVCGAPNTREGLKSAFALPGAKLPNGRKVGRVRIRGVESDGMLCAEDELGISDDHTGIVEFSDDVEVGIPVREAYKRDGITLEIDLTPNRPDCASHVGVAREISVITGNSLRLPDVDLTEGDKSIFGEIAVEIQDEKGCPRYCARLIRGVKIGESPEWLKRYLLSVGIRPINNVVDAANFVLMELGQPLHTFDYDKLEGGKIIVRKARDGEKVVTLDGVERELNREVLLICDGVKPVAIAGIMGLLNSEVDENTGNVLIESAYFDPATIRRGVKTLGLSTEASYRFERGCDPGIQVYAANRLAGLIRELAGGEICAGVIDSNPIKISPLEIFIRFARVDSIIGHRIDREWIVDKLIRLGCKVVHRDDNGLKVRLPSFRPDLKREIDIIEEVVRIYGLANIPSSREFRVRPSYSGNSRYDLVERLRELLFASGLIEVYNNSLVSENLLEVSFDRLRGVKIQNPLSRDMAYLRTSLLPGLLKTAQVNICRKNLDLGIFEIGNVHRVDSKGEFGVGESMRFGILLTGNFRRKDWYREEEKSTVFHLKGVLEGVLGYFGIGGVSYKPGDSNGIFAKSIVATCGGMTLGYIGEFDRVYLDKKWDIQQPVFVLEGDFDVVERLAKFDIKYRELPAYPSVERDISVVVRSEVKVADIESAIRKVGTELLESVRFYDLYQGKSIDKGYKSFTFNLVFRSWERTLKDEEVDEIIEKIIETLGKEFDARLR